MNDISLYERVPLIDNSFSVKLMTFNRAHNLLPHWHENIELLYFYRGECRFTAGGKSFDVTAGDLVVVNEGEMHSFDTHMRVAYNCVLLYPAFFSDIEFSNVILSNLIRGDRYVAECFDRMLAERESFTEGSDMLIKSHAYALMAHLLRNYTSARLSPKEYDARSARTKRINDTLEYLSNHYSEKITTSSLAERCYMSEEHFCRLFKRTVGKTVTEYISEYRIAKAAVLLAGTDESVTSVADSVGFDDVNYFSRTFRRLKGKTPTEYRKSKR